MSRSIVLAAVLCTLSLSGCVESAGPILPDAQPLFGKDVRLQFYTLRKGFADEPEQASFKWDGERYVHAGGGMSDVAAFTMHRLEGRTYIIQSAAAKRPNIIEYAVANKLTEGVYQVTPIDEDDAMAPRVHAIVSGSMIPIAGSRREGNCLPLHAPPTRDKRAKAALCYALRTVFQRRRARDIDGLAQSRTFRSYPRYPRRRPCDAGSRDHADRK